MQNEMAVQGPAVRVGSRVRIQDDAGVEVFELAGELADPFAGRLSVDSPLGRALLGRRAGDRVPVRSPGGPYGVTILDVA